MFYVKEQGLLDQNWQIITKKWFSNLGLNEIKEKSVSVTEECDENVCEGFFEFG